MAPLPRGVPRLLYKYRGVEHFYRDLRLLLDKRRLWLSAPVDLNDPYDCNLGVPGPPVKFRKQWFEHVLRGRSRPERARIRAAFAALDRPMGTSEHFVRLFLDTFGANIGVCSLSVPRAHPLLWAHYGGNSAGFSVGYRPVMELSIAAPTSRSTPFGIASIALRNVRYMHSRACAYSGWEPAIEGHMIDWFDAFRIKSKAWKYEREWRYLGGVRGTSFEVPAETIREICIGPRMSQAHRTELVAAARALPDRPRILQGELKRLDYGLSFTRIE